MLLLPTSLQNIFSKNGRMPNLFDLLKVENTEKLIVLLFTLELFGFLYFRTCATEVLIFIIRSKKCVQLVVSFDQLYEGPQEERRRRTTRGRTNGAAHALGAELPRQHGSLVLRLPTPSGATAAAPTTATAAAAAAASFPPR
jgi:hypothetical protein